MRDIQQIEVTPLSDEMAESDREFEEISDQLEQAETATTVTENDYEIDGVPLDAMDDAIGAQIERNADNAAIELARSGSHSADAEKRIAAQLEGEKYGAPEADRETLGAVPPPDPNSAYAQAKEARAAGQRYMQEAQRMPTPAPRGAVADPEIEYQRQQQMQAWRAAAANDAVASIVNQNNEAWLAKACEFAPEVYARRAQELAAMARQSDDAAEARQLMDEAQRMDYTASQVASRHEQIRTRLAFNDDAMQVVTKNPDLLDVSKGRGKMVAELFDEYPALCDHPKGASIVLNVVNKLFKGKREGR